MSFALSWPFKYLMNIHISRPSNSRNCYGNLKPNIISCRIKAWSTKVTLSSLWRDGSHEQGKMRQYSSTQTFLYAWKCCAMCRNFSLKRSDQARLREIYISRQTVLTFILPFLLFRTIEGHITLSPRCHLGCKPSTFSSYHLPGCSGCQQFKKHVLNDLK